MEHNMPILTLLSARWALTNVDRGGSEGFVLGVDLVVTLHGRGKASTVFQPGDTPRGASTPCRLLLG